MTNEYFKYYYINNDITTIYVITNNMIHFNVTADQPIDTWDTVKQ